MVNKKTSKNKSKSIVKSSTKKIPNKLISTFENLINDKIQIDINVSNISKKEIGNIKDISKDEIKSNIRDNLEEDIKDDIENIKSNVENNLKNGIENIFESNIENNIENNIDDNIENNIDDNLENNIENNIDDNLENNLDDNLENNLENNLDDNLENEIQNNPKNEIQTNPENEIQTNPENEIQNNPEINLDENLENEIQNNLEDNMIKIISFLKNEEVEDNFEKYDFYENNTKNIFDNFSEILNDKISLNKNVEDLLNMGKDSGEESINKQELLTNIGYTKIDEMFEILFIFFRNWELPNYEGLRIMLLNYERIENPEKNINYRITYKDENKLYHLKKQIKDFDADEDGFDDFLYQIGLERKERINKVGVKKIFKELEYTPCYILELGFQTGETTIMLLKQFENSIVISVSNFESNDDFYYSKIFIDEKYGGRHIFLYGDLNKQLHAFNKLPNFNIDFSIY